MDLSMRRQNAEDFEYRHKKFDQIRSSPVSVEPNICEDYARSMASTPHSIISTSNSTCRNGLKRGLEDDDTTWEPSADEIDFLPRTPTKRQRLQSRTAQNKRSASHELCNAPKKRKSTVIDAHARTPQKSAKMMQTTTSSFVPKISKETLARICQYNKNMVRKFPKKERTVKDQERRDKNTIACRMSRRLKKLENVAVEEQYKIFTQEYLDQSKQAMHAAVYLNELLKFDVNISPAHERSMDVLDTIARNLNLSHLKKIASNSKADAIEFDINAHNGIKRENSEMDQITGKQRRENQFDVQQKPSFSIAYLLGKK